MFNGQAAQDKFVLTVLDFKKNGYYVEIGSNHPIRINNTYQLEKVHGWKGIMVEYDASFLASYKAIRPNSIHVMQDATTIDYTSLFRDSPVPTAIDYLQIDLEVNNGSTLRVLQKLDEEVMDTHTFAVVTFEHDIYRSNYLDTREASRAIFKKRGYVCVFEDIDNEGYAFEDWYVHPSLVDVSYVSLLQEANASNYKANSIVGKSISWKSIVYPSR
jgi:hypothetical protein